MSLYRRRPYSIYIPILLAVALLASRRSEQLLSPQIWNEDGTEILARYLDGGWTTLFEPVSGYLLLIPKLISMVSITLSFSNYPAISTAIAWTFLVAVILGIALLPSKLEGKGICAISTLLIPTDPEAMGLPLYTLWWSALLVFLLTLWDEKDASLGLRLTILTICGLSSPVIPAAVPVFYLRARHWFRQYRSEQIVFISSIALSLIQVYLIYQEEGNSNFSAGAIASNFIPKFFGRFLIGNLTKSEIFFWIAGSFLLVALAYLFMRSWSHKHQITHSILLYLILASIILSLLRVNPHSLHPQFAGPRYFFFPYIFINWILIQFLFRESSKSLFFLILFLLCLSLINAVPVWSRHHPHEDLQWKQHLTNCPLFETYGIPVHSTGREFSAWYFRVKGEQCEQQLDRDPWPLETASKLFPYTVVAQDTAWDVDSAQNPGTLASSTVVLQSSLQSLDSAQVETIQAAHFDFSDYQLFSSQLRQDHRISTAVKLQMNRGDDLFYRSGVNVEGLSIEILGQEERFLSRLPAAQRWLMLSFSNQHLPDSFTVSLEDEGPGKNQWFAIAIKPNPPNPSP